MGTNFDWQSKRHRKRAVRYPSQSFQISFKVLKFALFLLDAERM